MLVLVAAHYLSSLELVAEFKTKWERAAYFICRQYEFTTNGNRHKRTDCKINMSFAKPKPKTVTFGGFKNINL